MYLASTDPREYGSIQMVKKLWNNEPILVFGIRQQEICYVDNAVMATDYLHSLTK